MKAAIYSRVSTEDQKERQTIDTQVEVCGDYCADNQIAVHAISIFSQAGR